MIPEPPENYTLLLAVHTLLSHWQNYSWTNTIQSKESESCDMGRKAHSSDTYMYMYMYKIGLSGRFLLRSKKKLRLL